jgi:D-alanyl-D-alanine carboxypeptidase/D-alanyl-D-alanine-endopeptidase (penicillin-binding protein 4)
MRFLKLSSVLLILIGTALGASAGQSPTAPPAVAPATTPAPVSAAVSALRNDLRALIRAPGWSSARYGVLVVSLDRGDTLFSLNPDVPLAPASNMKLYSTAAALYYLGPNFRYSTYVLGDGEVRDSVLTGDLILYGTGDPSISGRMLSGATSVLRSLADSLRAHGIREVQGDVVGDGSYYDDVRLGDAWNPDDLMAWYGAPISALSFAENMISVRVLPGSAPGQPARVVTTPATQGFAVANQVRTVATGGTLVRFERGENQLILRGQIRRGHPGVARGMPVVDPAGFSAAAFRSALENQGIRVRGDVRVARSPDESAVTLASPRTAASGAASPPPRVLAVHLSPPLSEIVSVTNHISHNLFAEALLKLVGRVALGEGSFEAGGRAIRYLLECETETDSAALHIVDGSGLSRLNRVTARSTIHLLDYMTRSDVWEPYSASLPEAAGRQGLRRMHGTPAAGNLRAKTGTIQNVSALSGYVRTANGERLAFSIIANDVPSTWRAKRIEDAIGARLAAFRRPPPEPSSPAADDDSPPLPESAAAPQGEEVTPSPPRLAPTRERTTPAPERTAPATRTHRVKQGETLDGIAKRYDVTIQALQKANPGLNPRRLQIGQTVKIPE